MLSESDIDLGDGRTLHVYDTGEPDGAAGPVVFWHHGTPNLGAPPKPLFPASELLGIRWISFDRPGYGESTSRPGRDIASVAEYVAVVADRLGVERFAVMGHSGGGPHALACAALIPDRVLAVVSGSGLAPFGADGLDWFAGMAPSSAASLEAAAQGRAAKEAHEAAASSGDIGFIPADFEALDGEWSWFGEVVGPALLAGPDALIDDDLAYVSPWGFDPAMVTAPVLFFHGQQDRMVPASHSEWLARQCPQAELRLYPDDGHVSVLRHGASALDWLAEHAGR